MNSDLEVALSQPLDDGLHVLERFFGSEDLRVSVHFELQFFANRRDVFRSVRGAHLFDEPEHEGFRRFRHRGSLGLVGVGGGVTARALSEHVDVEQRVGSQTVRAVNRHTRALAGGIKPWDYGRVVDQHLGVRVGRDSAHRIVCGRHHGDRLGDRVDAEVGAGELGDIGKFRFENLGTKVRAVQQHVVLVGSGATALGDLLNHAAGNDVTRCEVLDGRGVSLHKSLTVRVPQNRTFTSGALGEEDSESGEPGRVELEELHVFERDAFAPDDADAVTGEGVRVRGGLEHFAETARCKNHRGGVEYVDVTGR